MTSWKSVIALLFVSACAGESSDAQREAQVRARALALAPKPVRMRHPAGRRLATTRAQVSNVIGFVRISSKAAAPLSSKTNSLG